MFVLYFVTALQDKAFTDMIDLIEAAAQGALSNVVY
jgi:hypothetical protein